jgi:peptide/nickel transport system substrate-binding protein
MSNRIPKAIVFFSVLLLTCGCVHTTPSGNVLYVGAPANPLTLNPLFVRDGASAELVPLFHPLLIRTDRLTLEPVPAVFSSWTLDDDGVRYVFTLRNDIFWSDGKPLTAEDVAFTLRIISHPDYTGWLFQLLKEIQGADDYKEKHGSVYADGEIEGIRVIDDYTLEIHLEKRFAPFLSRLTLPPLPAHVLRYVPVAEMESHAYGKTLPVSAGPYVFRAWFPDEYVHGRANPGYYLGEPGIRDIYYRIIPNQEAQMIELSAGRLDLVPTAVRVEDITYFQAMPHVRVHKNPRLVYDYIGFNLKRPQSPVADRRVRQALSMLLDKDEIVDNLLLNCAQVVHGPLLPPQFAYDKEFAAYSKDHKKAVELLREAGFQQQPLKLVYHAGNVVRENVALLFKESAAEIGVTVEVVLLEWESFLAALNDGDYDLILLGRGVDADPDFSFHWHSESPANAFGYANKEVDLLLDAASSVPDRDTRTRLYREAEKLIVKDAPVIWLYTRSAVHAVANRVINFNPHPEALFYFVEEWGLEQ